MDAQQTNELWTLGRFIEAAQEYNLHVGLAEYKLCVVESALTKGLGVNSPEVTKLVAEIAAHEQEIDIHETTLRQFVERYPRLRSHWAVSEYELNFLDV